ncbi:MAG TPA: alkaline phosphatase family protein [Jiangellales bacterium]|nr:alkaline phosphatase family protein [Jiangellales bacterium]
MSDLRDKAVDALVDPAWAHVVDLVAHPDGDGGVVVANSAGAARLAPGDDPEVVWGADPVADQDPMAFLPYDRELADPSPPGSRNAYPYAAERLLPVFADPDRSPDLVVVHTPRHYFPEHGGHAGEHGSLDVIQSRAPLLLSGPGVRERGVLDDHARLVDVGPTLASLAGVDGDGGRLVDEAGRPLDGRVLDRLVGPGASWVVGILWDGAHCSDLLHLVARGDLPGVARLLDRGCALAGGAVAEFPSVTLTNHTSILTGVAPGRHGVLGNAYYDRATSEVVVPNDAATWHRSAEWLRPGVTTVFEQVAAARPGVSTACVNEAVDRGATWSTMSLVRDYGVPGGAGGLDHLLPDPAASRYLSSRDHLTDAGYAWATQVDDAGVEHLLALWARPVEAPALTWWSHVVTDAGHHAGGPRSRVARDSLADADRRLQVFLDHLDGLGVTDDVVVLLTADHGCEAADPRVRGDWDDALSAAGLPFRDVGPGFVYLGEDVAG